MRIDIITCLPALLESPFGYSIVRRAINKGLVDIQLHDLRRYGVGKHRQVDDKAYGGSAGMVLMIEPIVRCIEALKAERRYDEIIYMSADGAPLTQKMANGLSVKKNLLMLCGHYKGVDERVRMHLVTKEISLGEYVISGGELAAAVVVDSIVRLLPGVLSDATSALTDSYQNGLIAPPVYSRPAFFQGWKVPEVLCSGNHKEIEKWEDEQSFIRTKQRKALLD